MEWDEIVLAANDCLNMMSSYPRGMYEMKIRSMIVLIAVSVLFTSACAFGGRTEEPATGKYVMQGAPIKEWAWVLLEEDHQFKFNRNLATSYLPMGTYSVEKDELLLKVNDKEIYRFRIEGDRLIFESGELAESLVDIGTVFELTKDK